MEKPVLITATSMDELETINDEYTGLIDDGVDSKTHEEWIQSQYNQIIGLSLHTSQNFIKFLDAQVR